MAKSRIKKDSHTDKLVEEIRSLGQTYGINHVFSTFLELMALSLSVETDPACPEERKKRREELEAGMEQSEATAYARMVALLYMAVREYEDDPMDILGTVYHELRLNNEWNGQFFTPDHISRLMAMITGLPPEDNDGGVITINEPACGSGTLVIGAVWAMKQKAFDYRSKTLFIAQDIDIRCVWMTYIQLCLYKVPAVVIHGNTLTVEEWSRWYTPYAIELLVRSKMATLPEVEALA